MQGVRASGARRLNKRKKPPGKNREAPLPVAYGSDNTTNEKSPTSVEQPKRMSFTELAEELTRRSKL